MAEQRVTQLPVEVVSDASAPIRVTQEAIEYLADADPQDRVTQLAVEVVNDANPQVRTSQLVIEVVMAVALQYVLDPIMQPWGSALGDFDGGQLGGSTPNPGGRLDEGLCECVEQSVFTDCLDGISIDCD